MDAGVDELMMSAALAASTTCRGWGSGDSVLGVEPSPGSDPGDRPDDRASRVVEENVTARGVRGAEPDRAGHCVERVRLWLNRQSPQPFLQWRNPLKWRIVQGRNEGAWASRFFFVPKA